MKRSLLLLILIVLPFSTVLADEYSLKCTFDGYGDSTESATLEYNNPTAKISKIELNLVCHTSETLGKDICGLAETDGFLITGTGVNNKPSTLRTMVVASGSYTSSYSVTREASCKNTIINPMFPGEYENRVCACNDYDDDGNCDDNGINYFGHVGVSYDSSKELNDTNYLPAKCLKNMFYLHESHGDGDIFLAPLCDSSNLVNCQSYVGFFGWSGGTGYRFLLLSKEEREETNFEGSDKYKDITSCRDSDYKYIKECGCMPASITDLTSRLYMLIKIAAPALLLVIGGFDLIKAMSSQDESAINKARQKLLRKFIAAAAIFLIFTLIQFIVSTLSNDASTTMKCVDYILNGYVA